MNPTVLAVLSLIVFVLTVLLGVKRKINLGILGISAAFLLGFLILTEGGSMSAVSLKGKPLTSLFPFNIFWMTLSVSLMLNIGSTNGTFDIVIKKLVRVAKGNRAMLPVFIFLIMFVVSAVGGGSSGIVVLLCTIAATIAKDQDIDPVFLLLSVLCGAAAAVGSPVSIIAIICNSYTQDLWQQTVAPGYMMLRGFAIAALNFVVIYVFFKGWKLKKRPQEKEEALGKLNSKQILTLVGMGVFVVLGMVVGFDLGLSAFIVTALLLFLGCADEKEVIANVPWASIIMIAGMCILIGTVEAAGGIKLLTDTLGLLMNKYTVKPLYSLIGSLLSMVSSMTGVVLPSMIPTMPQIALQTGVNPLALVTALACGGEAVVTCPVSSMGAIALGIMSMNKDWDSAELFKKLMTCSIILMITSAVWAAIGIA